VLGRIELTIIYNLSPTRKRKREAATIDLILFSDGGKEKILRGRIAQYPSYTRPLLGRKKKKRTDACILLRGRWWRRKSW